MNNEELNAFEIEISDLETTIKDFEIGDELSEVILLGKTGAVRRIIL